MKDQDRTDQPVAVTGATGYVGSRLVPRLLAAGRRVRCLVRTPGKIQTIARICGLPRRLVLPVPLLTPHLSSLWISLVTPISARIARPLTEGLRNPVVCPPGS